MKQENIENAIQYANVNKKTVWILYNCDNGEYSFSTVSPAINKYEKHIVILGEIRRPRYNQLP
jgi:hypothetical protein